MLRTQRARDILKLVLSDERIPDNLITVFYTDFVTGSEARKPLTEFHQDPVLGLNMSDLGIRDCQITCLKLLDKVVWDRQSGLDLISTSSPPAIYALLEKTCQDSSLAEVDKLAVGCKAPEHLKRLCDIQASKSGFRKHRFFICQRVYDEALIEKAVDMQTKICEQFPILKESCYPPGWFHVTLCTFCPAGPEELHLSVRILQRLVDKYYSECRPTITFLHVQQFTNFVMVVMALIIDEINEIISSAFRENGIEVDDHEFNAHMTVIKPPAKAARKLSGRLNAHKYFNKRDIWDTRQLLNRLDVYTRHFDGSPNEVTDALSGPSIAHPLLSPGTDLAEMAAEQHRVASPCVEDDCELQLQELPLITGNGTILCYVFTLSHRPFVSPSFRRNVFSFLHNLSHPGSRTTDKLVSDRFVWSGRHKDLKAWTWARIACQRSKVQWHNKVPIGIFPGPDARFGHFHLDIVGPFLCSVAVFAFGLQPMARLQAGWSYGSIANIKTSLHVADDPENRTDHFSLILLGIRSALKPDLDCCAAEMVFGATVQLPGGMILPTPRGAVEHPTNLLHRLRQFIGTLPPVTPGSSSSSQSRLETDLATCSHVYLRCDRVRWPLEPPYDGPFRVLYRGTKKFRIQRASREEVVSVDHRKESVPNVPSDESCGLEEGDTIARRRVLLA
ncbi:hypothetical protein SprV_0401480500 [Sparganum proliferum]